MKQVPAGFIATSFRTLLPFRTIHAWSTTEAVNAIGEAERAAVLAGGTDLPARFNEGFHPTDLIDISRIATLRSVVLSKNAIEIGAAVTHAAGASHPLIRRHLPSFAQAWSRIANIRIRFSATIGGNLMARRTRYEGAILLSALGARLRFRAPIGEFEIAAENIWSDATPMTLLTAVIIPLRKGLRLDYARELRPVITQAVALDDDGCGRVVTATEHVIPRVRPIEDGTCLRSGAELDFDDPVTSAVYLQRVSDTLLARQLERMARQ
jgi:carbon-monoxide dehydrogenase medium subunit